MTSHPKATDGLELRAVDAEFVVHDPLHQRVHVLNQTAAEVLRLCDGTHRESEIADSLARRTGAPTDRVRADVDAVLATFRDLQLLV